MPAGIGVLETAFINLINDSDKAGFLTALVLFRLLTVLNSLLILILNMTNTNDNT